MISTLCRESAASSNEEASMIQRILSDSTLYLVPEIPHTQVNCHDYGTISPFYQIIAPILDKIPEIDLVILVATGGLKVRFIDNNLKLAKTVGNRNGEKDFGTMGAEMDPSIMMAIAEATKTNNKPPTMLLAELYVMTHDQMKQV